MERAAASARAYIHCRRRIGVSACNAHAPPEHAPELWDMLVGSQMWLTRRGGCSCCWGFLPRRPDACRREALRTRCSTTRAPATSRAVGPASQLHRSRQVHRRAEQERLLLDGKLAAVALRQQVLLKLASRHFTDACTQVLLDLPAFQHAHERAERLKVDRLLLGTQGVGTRCVTFLSVV